MQRPKVVDVHAHITPRRFQDVVNRGNDWHGMTTDDGELWNIRNRWNPQQRLEEMDAIKVDVQMLSPTIDFYQYHREGADTARIASETNDEVADLVREYPERFVGLGTLPMQDADRTNEELVRGMNELGLRGFEIGDHVNGLTYDNEFFDPFWETVNELGAFILVHQYRATCVLYRTRNYSLGNSIGNLVDRTLTFGCLVFGGVMDKYPDLQICLSHGGGYTSFGIDRMDKAWEAFPQLQGKSSDRPSSYLKRFYYDSITWQERTLRFILDVVGADRVLFGTDWPAPMMVDDPVRLIESMEGIRKDERDAILSNNAALLLGSANALPAAN